MFKITLYIINKMNNYNYLIHIFIPILLAIIVNIYLYQNDVYKNNTRNKYLPPGYVIGITWIIILGLLGYIHYLTYNSPVSFFVIIVITYCLIYPFLTKNKNNEDSVKYNLIALILSITLFIIISVKYQKNYLYIYTIPLLLWTIYVYIVTKFFSKI